MRDTNVFVDELGIELNERGRWARWIVPMVLLLLVLVLVMFAALARHVQAPLGAADIVLYILTALLCTLVAVFLTLTGCSEQFAKMEQGIGEMAAEVASVRNEQGRLSKTVLAGDQEVRGELSRTEESHRHLADNLDRLTKNVEAMTSNIAAAKDTEGALRQMVQDGKEELAHGISGIKEQQTMAQEAIRGFQEVGASLSDQITTISHNQETLHKTLLEKSEHIAGRMTAVAATQERFDNHLDNVEQSIQAETDRLGETHQRAIAAAETAAATQGHLQEVVKAQSEELTGRMAALSEGLESLQAVVGSLDEKADRGIAEVAGVATKQASLGEVFRAHAEALEARMAAGVATPEQLEHHFNSLEQCTRAEMGRLAETHQQSAAAVNAVAAEQSRLQETVNAKSEELIGRVASLWEGLETLRASVGSLNEKADREIAEVAGVATQQTSLGDAFRAHAEALEARMSAGVATPEQLDHHFRCLEQSTRAEIERLVETHQQSVAATDAVAVEQRYVQETLGAKSEELIGRVANLSEGLETLRAHAEALEARTSAGVATPEQLEHHLNNLEQFARAEIGRLAETLRAHAEAVEGRMSAGVATPEQLEHHFNNLEQFARAEIGRLAEIHQQSAATTDAVAVGQGHLQETVNAKSEELIGRVADLWEGLESLRGSVGGLYEKADHGIAEVAGVANQQASLGEVLRAHAEAFDARISELAALREQVDANLQKTQVLAETTAGGLAEVASGQAGLGQMVQEGKEELARGIEGITEHQTATHEAIQDLQQAGAALSERIETMSHGQEILQQTVSGEHEHLAGRMSALTTAQEQLDGHFSSMQQLAQEEIGKLAEASEQVAAATGLVAAEQGRLQETVKTQNAESMDRMAGLSEGLGALREKADHGLAEISALANRQASFREALRAHSEASDVRMSAVVASQEQMDAGLQSTRSLIETATEGLTEISNGQVTLHGVLRDNGKLFAENVRVVEQSHQALEAEVNGIAETGQKMTTAAAAMAAAQTKLQESLDGSIGSLSGRITTLCADQQTLQNDVTNLNEKADHVAEDISLLAGEQASVGEALRAHGEVIETEISGLAVAHGQLDTRLAALTERAQTIASGVTTVAQEQNEIHRTLEESNAMLAQNIGTLEQNQVTLQHGVTALGEKTGEILTGQAALHETVSSTSKELADKLVTLLESQLAFHAGVSGLSEKTNNIVAELTGVAANQAALNEALHVQHETLNTKMSGLAAGHEHLEGNILSLHESVQTFGHDVTGITEGQNAVQETLEQNSRALTDNAIEAARALRNLQDEVSQAAEVGRQTALTVTSIVAEQATLHDAVGTGNEKLADQMAGVGESQRLLNSTMTSLDSRADQVAREIATLATDQATLHEMVRTHSESADGAMSTLITSLGETDSNMKLVQQRTETLVDSVADIANGQTAMHKTLADSGQALTDSVAVLRQHQEAFEQELRKAADTDKKIAAAVEAMAADQAVVHDGMKTHNEELTCQISALSENQQSLRVEIDRATAMDEQTASAMAAISAKQAALEEMAMTHGEELDSRFSSLSESQQIMHNTLTHLEGQAGQMNAAIDSLNNAQATLHKLAQDNGTALSDRVSLTIQKQQEIQSSLEELQRTHQAASDAIASLAGKQAELGETAHQENGELLVQLTTLAGNHGQLHSNVNSMREIVQKVAGNLTSVADEQTNAHRTLQENTQALAENTTTVQQGLTALQVEVSRAADASRQAVDTVAAMVNEEVAMLETIKGYSEELAGKVGLLSENQQASHDALNSTVREVGGDLETITVKQGQLEQVIQTSREDLLTRLGCVADAQHKWIERFEAAQVEIQNMVSGVASMARTLADIEGTFQQRSEELAHILDGQEKQQVEFESKVSQGFAAVTESISEILEIREMLHDQARELKENAQDQEDSDDITWAKEQLRRHVDASNQSSVSSEAGCPDGTDPGTETP